VTIEKVAPGIPARQGSPELDAATKRLLLSAHLGLVFKKLRRGLCVEEQELLALLPFTVPNGWQEESRTKRRPDEQDQRWLQLVESARGLG
jgi:hypothetical protein